jgi:hypothetical protein
MFHVSHCRNFGSIRKSGKYLPGSPGSWFVISGVGGGITRPSGYSEHFDTLGDSNVGMATNVHFGEEADAITLHVDRIVTCALLKGLTLDLFVTAYAGIE